ncbi:MAG: hypothetical protein MUF75_03320 [Bacteroidia bacterium]|jgi:hypothetical protein|nr:hypothetical protein [Bacteroidia bacterium]
MEFTGNESEQITKTEAIAWTTSYREAHPNSVRAHAFGKNKIQDLLNQSGCVGLRAYYAIDNTGAKQLVLVGVDQHGEDLYDGVILDRANPCPNDCAENSPLNS